MFLPNISRARQIAKLRRKSVKTLYIHYFPRLRFNRFSRPIAGNASFLSTRFRKFRPGYWRYCTFGNEIREIRREMEDIRLTKVAILGLIMFVVRTKISPLRQISRVDIKRTGQFEKIGSSPLAPVTGKYPSIRRNTKWSVLLSPWLHRDFAEGRREGIEPCVFTSLCGKVKSPRV